MEHFSIGSYVRMLTSCAVSAERKFDPFCEKIMLALCPDGADTFSYVDANGNEVIYTYPNFNKIHSAGQNLPTEVTRMVSQRGSGNIQKSFVKEIIPCLDESRKKNAVLAIKNVILKDKGIPDSTLLGTIRELTKGELRNKNDFVLSEFLADTFIFAVEKTDNLKEATFTKSIKKTYCSAYDQMTDSIKLYEVSAPKGIALIPLTSRGKFDQVFSPVSAERLSVVSKDHDLQIFCMKFDDYDFDYHGLWKYLRNNIGYYVYSRAEVNRLMDEDEIGSIAYDAVDHIKQTADAGGGIPENMLSELMLYIFLEQVLKAPKFMSKVELGAYGGIHTSESSGIHILTTDVPTPISQVILGASMIDGNIQSAVDTAFAAAKRLESRRKKERRFVESKIFAESFSKEVSDQLEKIILPSEAEEKKPTTAFGIFLGYTIDDVDKSGKSVEQYQDDVAAQAASDIKANISYIEQKITEHGLEGYSIYIYLLPFKDADADKKEIVDRLLQIGGASDE